MRRRFPITTTILIGILMIGASLVLWGCGAGRAPVDSSSAVGANVSTTQTSLATSVSILADPNTLIAQPIEQLLAVLGLPEGAVTRSSEEPMKPVLPGAEVVLAWADGGSAGLDLDTGRIVSIIPGTRTSGSEPPLGSAELDKEASRIAELLGWNSTTLATEGFTAAEAKIIPHGDAPTEYSTRWEGHDDQGLANGGLIDVALDAADGTLLHFFYHPGARAALDASGAISKDDAIRIAKEYIGDESQAPTTNTTPPGESATTTAPLGVLVRSAELVHSDAPGITGGRDMLVWIVKLGGSTATGEVRATVYVDALTGGVLTWLVF